MIGTQPNAQLTIGRIVRISGAGLVGAMAALGVLLSFFLSLTTRRVTGCIVETGPEPIASIVIAAAAGLVAALLGCARTTTAALVGSLLLGTLAIFLGDADEHAGVLGLLLAVALLVTAVIAKCIEEFPSPHRS